jgi:twitching motility protein PilT
MHTLDTSIKELVENGIVTKDAALPFLQEKMS